MDTRPGSVGMLRFGMAASERVMMLSSSAKLGATARSAGHPRAQGPGVRLEMTGNGEQKHQPGKVFAVRSHSSLIFLVLKVGPGVGGATGRIAHNGSHRVAGANAVVPGGVVAGGVADHDIGGAG